MITLKRDKKRVLKLFMEGWSMEDLASVFKVSITEIEAVIREQV